uniref:Uncharacterized protein n=1 Tax=Tetradesmus obliquus TaxID=3088 RepID=A0A383WJM1_TETOB
MATELSSIRLYICFLQVEGLQELTGLLFLDISHNMVQQLDAQQLPGSIKYFKAAGNPCMGQPGLAQQLAQHLPRLRELDGQDVSRSTAVTEGDGLHLPADEEQDASSAGSSGTSDAEDAGDSCAISRHLAGLQQLEQTCRSRQLASAVRRSSGCSTSQCAGHVTAACDIIEHGEPVLQSEPSSGWVADVRCSQQLLQCINKSCSNASGNTQHAEGTQPSYDGQQEPSLGPAAILRKSISLPGCRHSSSGSSSSIAGTAAGTSMSASQLTARTLQGGTSSVTRSSRGNTGDSTDKHSSSSSSSSSNTKLAGSQCVQAPRLLSRPQSAGGYLPTKPRLCPAASATEAATAANLGRNSASPALVDRADKAAVAAAAAKQPAPGKRLQRQQQQQQQQQAAVQQHMTGKPGAHLTSFTSSKPITNTGQARRQVASTSSIDSQAAGKMSTHQGGTSSSISSTSKLVPRSQSQSHNSSRTSTQTGKAKPHVTGTQGSTPKSGHAGSKPTNSSKGVAATAAATAAVSALSGQHQGSAAPRRLPSLQKTIIKHEQQPSQEHSAKREAGQTSSSCSARPASAGLRLAPVQHPALSAAYVQRSSCSRGSSSSSGGCSTRPSTSASSASADVQHATRALNSKESQPSTTAEEMLSGSELAQCAASDTLPAAADSVAVQLPAAEDRCQLLQGCVAAATPAAGAMPFDADMLNAVAANGVLAISSTAAAIQQRSKQRAAEARQQQAQEQQQWRQHLQQGIKQLKERGALLMRAGHPGGSSKGQLAAAAGPRPGCLLPASADTVAAEVASRAERLRARLAAAGLQVQEAAEAATAGPEAPDGAVAAMTGCYEQEDTAVSSSGAHNMFSSDDEAVCASPAQQAQASPAGSVPELHADINEDALEDSASAGSDSSSDSELESLVARMFKPAALPDWTSSGEAASFSQAGASRASSEAATDSDDETFRHMFAVSLPPGL